MVTHPHAHQHSGQVSKSATQGPTSNPRDKKVYMYMVSTLENGWSLTELWSNTGQKSHYPPGNPHASHL